MNLNEFCDIDRNLFFSVKRIYGDLVRISAEQLVYCKGIIRKLFRISFVEFLPQKKSIVFFFRCYVVCFVVCQNESAVAFLEYKVDNSLNKQVFIRKKLFSFAVLGEMARRELYIESLFAEKLIRRQYSFEKITREESRDRIPRMRSPL